MKINWKKLCKVLAQALLDSVLILFTLLGILIVVGVLILLFVEVPFLLFLFLITFITMILIGYKAENRE